MHRLGLLSCLSCLGFVFACGGDDNDSSASTDCRTAETPCPVELTCQLTSNGDYECLPINEGGMPGDDAGTGGMAGSDGGNEAGSAGTGGMAGSTGGNEAGSAGTGGMAGSTGGNEAGTAGTGGMAGSTGGNEAGTAGTGGMAGSDGGNEAGTAGTGGMAGSDGGNEAGTAGTGGMAGSDGGNEAGAAGEGGEAGNPTEMGIECSGEPSVCDGIRGDGLIRGTETCDDGNTADGDGCSSNGDLESGFECFFEPSVCYGIRGDGLIRGTEVCDDGNTTHGDGCSGDGFVESGFECSGEPSVCEGIQGDGLIRGTENCDDGNDADGDGCSAGGTIENSFECSGEPSVCDGVRGDGLIRGTETCDDGNGADGDGCSEAGMTELGFGCTGEPSVCERLLRIDFIPIPGGTFEMGSIDTEWAQPVHTVTVPDFEMARSEVTIGEYRVCVDAGVCPTPVCRFPEMPEGTEEHPVSCVRWEHTQLFAAFVGARLPTEAEWEYAARSGGQEIDYPWGPEPATCDRFNFGPCERGPMPVCSLPLGHTVHGLCDMAGNIHEWIEDDWHADYTGAPNDGSAWVDEPRNNLRVTRGGSSGEAVERARVTVRENNHFRDDNGRTGFRLARDARDDSDVAVSDECRGIQEGSIINEGQFGACEGFSDLCDTEGERTRVDQVCIQGVLTDVSTSEPCTRSPSDPIVEPTRVTACVPVEGATLRLGRASIYIPPQALSTPSAITFEGIGAVEDQDYIAFGEQYRLSPTDLQLREPALLTLPYTGSGGEVVIFWQNRNPTFDVLRSTIEEGALVRAEIREFGTGFAGSLCSFNELCAHMCLGAPTRNFTCELSQVKDLVLGNDPQNPSSVCGLSGGSSGGRTLHPSITRWEMIRIRTTPGCNDQDTNVIDVMISIFGFDGWITSTDAMCVSLNECDGCTIQDTCAQRPVNCLPATLDGNVLKVETSLPAFDALDIFVQVTDESLSCNDYSIAYSVNERQP